LVLALERSATYDLMPNLLKLERVLCWSCNLP